MKIKSLFKNLNLFKNYSARKLIKNFPVKGLDFPKTLRESGSTGRKPGSGMQQTIIDNAIDEWRARLRACVFGPEAGTLNICCTSLIVCSCWFMFFILVFLMHVKTGNNDDFIAYLNVTFNGRCLLVFVLYVL